MRAENFKPPHSNFWLLRSVLPAVAALGVVLTISTTDNAGHARASEPQAATHQDATTAGGYVGSKVCSQCHRPIYNQFSRTDMGRSMSSVSPSVLDEIPNSAAIFDPRLNRRFDVFVEGGNLYESEYETGPDGKDIFRDTHKVEWIIGSGANGFGAIMRRGNYLFEAPLSFYSKTHSWALSPGYEFADYGFSRPILPGCIVCHSGQPQPVRDGNGLYRDPPFTELAIGCENCHGPGKAHVQEMQEGDPSPGSTSHSIVNPAKLPSWLADNICMSCHQTGDARVLKPGKDYRDFRPGTPLDDTLTIFMAPPKRESLPQSDLLEHYFSMTLSKCYRGSGGRLSCITCHNPHVEPARQEVSTYYRDRCLTCHTESSCAVPLAIRKRKNPPDDCSGCHMPKRDVREISHAVLTNHRIIAEVEEPYPDATFHMASPQLPDLVHLSAIPGQEDTSLSQLTLLEAYGQLMASHPEYHPRYLAVAKQLQATEPENIYVLEALADGAIQERSAEGTAAAIRYLDHAIKRGATSPADFEQLASLLVRAGRLPEAVDLLQRGIKLIPYDAELYRLLGASYISQNKPSEALSLLTQAIQFFPQDRVIRKLLKECEGVKPGN